MSQLEQLAKAIGTSAPHLFSDIAENIQLGLYIYRLEYVGGVETLRVIYANPAAAALTGIPVDQSVNRTIEELFPQLPETEMPQLFAEVARSGRPQARSDFQYGDDRIATATWSFKAFPLPDRCVGVAFENISPLRKAEEEARRQVERLTALRNIDLAIVGSLDLTVTLQILLDQVTNQLNAEAASVLLYSASTQTLDFAAARGFRQPGLHTGRMRLDEGLPGRVARERRVVSVPDLRTEKGLLRRALVDGEGFVSYWGVPLIAKGSLRGVLEVFQRTPTHRNSDWTDFLATLAGQAAIALEAAFLHESLQRSSVELTLAYDSTLEGWARALELRSLETEGHARRVTELTIGLAQAANLCQDQLVHLRRGSLLHDIGKIAIPDSILLKPGPLTEEEWVIMRKHPVYAYELLSPIPFLGPALDIPYCHHERWDGRGYPRRLAASQIPLPARIFAVADAWDAMRSDRPYRDALSEDEALRQIEAGSGIQFDPDIAATFLRAWKSGELAQAYLASSAK